MLTIYFNLDTSAHLKYTDIMKYMFTLLVTFLSPYVHANSSSCDSYLRSLADRQSSELKIYAPNVSTDTQALSNAYVQTEKAFNDLKFSERLEIEKTLIELNITRIEITDEHTLTIRRNQFDHFRTLYLPYTKVDIILNGEILSVLDLFKTLDDMFPESSDLGTRQDTKTSDDFFTFKLSY